MCPLLTGIASGRSATPCKKRPQEARTLCFSRRSCCPVTPERGNHLTISTQTLRVRSYQNLEYGKTQNPTIDFHCTHRFTQVCADVSSQINFANLNWGSKRHWISAMSFGVLKFCPDSWVCSFGCVDLCIYFWSADLCDDDWRSCLR